MGDIVLSWSYTEEFVPESEPARAARLRAAEFGLTPVSTGTGAALRALAATVGARSVAEIGTGTGVASVWLLEGMADDGVLIVVSIAFKPRTLLYPNPAPCFAYPWTSRIVSSMSISTRSSAPTRVPV